MTLATYASTQSFYTAWIKEAFLLLDLSQNHHPNSHPRGYWPSKSDIFAVSWMPGSCVSFPNLLVRNSFKSFVSPIPLTASLTPSTYTEKLLHWAYNHKGLSFSQLTAIVALFGNNRFVPPE